MILVIAILAIVFIIIIIMILVLRLESRLAFVAGAREAGLHLNIDI